jgi:hypothetical protein
MGAYVNPIYPYKSPADLMSTPPQRKPLIVIGAGPVGLAAAIDARLQGLDVLVLDDDKTVSIGSRAVCYAKRSLEILDRLGIANEACGLGVSWNIGRTFLEEHEVYQFNLVPDAGHKRPGMINLQQYHVEEMLIARALELGADIILHSATKYLGGHSDLVLGLLAVADKALAERLYFIQNASGAVCGPMDSFLALRGIKTLHVRMDRHCSNAEAVAAHLVKHPAVRKVYYPGLKDHPGHAVAARQMKQFGGMVSFALHDDDLAKASAVVSALKVFTLAESLGGVESLAGHPATMTHASIPKAEREKTGVTDGLIRLSVGLEDIRDLTADLDQALSVLLK